MNGNSYLLFYCLLETTNPAIPLIFSLKFLVFSFLVTDFLVRERRHRTEILPGLVRGISIFENTLNDRPEYYCIIC